MKPFLKTCLPHVGALTLFLVLIIIYFYPAFDGKTLQQGDIIHYKGVAQEVVKYGKPSGWTGSVFSGMPSYQITGYSKGFDALGFVKGHIFGAIQSETAGPILIFLITSYLLFIIMGAPVWLSIMGAIAMAFSSYNIIIIVAGHVTKAWALAFVPLVLTGMFVTFKGKYWQGLILFAFGLGLEVISNHLQITYYTALFCAILFLGFALTCILEKEYKRLGMASGTLIIGTILAIGSCISNLYINYEVSKESTRGRAELSPMPGNKTTDTDGLDKDYAFGWSYGKAETFTLLIPNAMGGSSKSFAENSEPFKALVSKARSGEISGEDAKQLSQFASEYWGDKQFTAGPVYIGAIICFLSLFAFLIVPKSSKWWLLAATVFFIFLAWGRNFASFNDFMFYNFPFYNKFRTVEMALVIPALTIPILAVMAVKELIFGNIPTAKIKKTLIYSTSIVGGICLLFWALPELIFSFQSPMEVQAGLPDWYAASLINGRKGLLQTDAIRSLVFILLAAGLLFWHLNAKNKSKSLIVGIGLITLVLCDLWMVDKRYLNDKNFVNQQVGQEQSFKKSIADTEILKDHSISYRVLDLNNPFQNANTSYYHKSIGGYHAAKLRRYQDLIEHRLTKEMQTISSIFSNEPSMEKIMNAIASCNSLNMLNTKYIIYNPGQAPIENPYRLGNAWFVESYRFVNSPEEEMKALESLNPSKEAVLDKKFEENLKGLQLTPDSMAKIELIKYLPNQLDYKSFAQKEGLAVLSEIYYSHGWKAYIDGKQVPISRADWVLRAIVIPAGEHQIKLTFEPDQVNRAALVSTLFSGVLVLMVIIGIAFFIHQKRNKNAGT